MERQIITKTIRVEGMTCASCEMRIENKLKKIPGVSDVRVKYADELAQFTYDSDQVQLLDIIEAIEAAGYTPVSRTKGREAKSGTNITKLLGIGVIIFAVYFVLNNSFGINLLDIFNFIPEVNQNMGYGILFVVGLLTSIHCISMCGGINLSQCVSYNANRSDGASKLKPSILYNAGRVVSYTIIGGIVGAIGSVVSLSGSAQGLVSILAGVFMLIMGLNMLNIFPALRKFVPRMPKFFGQKVHSDKGKNGPFIVGLLNGFMPCGPLQSMQLYALGTGSFFAGALSMFLFSLGTVPLMFGFGAISTMLSSKFTAKMMKASAALVMILGVIMLNRGFALSGIDPMAAFATMPANASSAENAAVINNGVQYITTQFTGNRYAPITVQSGIPVQWTVQIESERDLNGCNNPIQIPEYGIRNLRLEVGDNLIEFTPGESGTVPYSCWMGMIRSRIIVVDDLGDATQLAAVSADYEDDIGAGGSEGSGLFDGIWALPVDNLISTDVITPATISESGEVQEITVLVKSDGFSPGVIVLQDGIDFVINFEFDYEVDRSDPYNGYIYFPEYQGLMDLFSNPSSPVLPTFFEDFSFEDGNGTRRGFITLVEDLNDFDLSEVIECAENYQVDFGGASCH